jgi:hypothetical protein
MRLLGCWTWTTLLGLEFLPGEFPLDGDCHTWVTVWEEDSGACRAEFCYDVRGDYWDAWTLEKTVDQALSGTQEEIRDKASKWLKLGTIPE